MNIIDINCMIGPWQEYDVRFYDTHGLLEHLDRYRIREAVAFHSDALWNPAAGNRKMLASTSADTSGRLHTCLVLEPALGVLELPAPDEVGRMLREHRPAAVRLYPNRHNYTVDRFYCGSLLEVLNSLALPVLFADDQMPSYQQLPTLARDFPNIPFVLLRRPIREARYIMPLLDQTDNVYVDASILIDTALVDHLVQRVGAGRLLFGSNLPFHEPSGALGLIMYARISDTDRQAILADNWTRLQEGVQWT